MKKYLITEEQLRNIKTVFVLYGLGAPFEDLKPIEPLSEKEILKAIQSCGQELHGRIALTYESGPYDIDTPTVVATQFARAIEAHIIGEKK